MSILNRFSDIVNSNVNSMLDQAEDPAKMVNFITREMEQTLVTIRSESSRFLAEKKHLKNRITRLKIESAQWQARAELAIAKDRDDLAKSALKEKNLHEEAISQCEVEIEHIDTVIVKLGSDARQLAEKLKFTRAKQKAIVLRGNSVKSRMKVKRQLHDASCDEALERFEAYERKLDEMEGVVESWDLGPGGQSDSHNATLEAELDSLANEDKLDTELDNLKQRLNSRL